MASSPTPQSPVRGIAPLLMAHAHEISDRALVPKRNVTPGYTTSWHQHDCAMLLLPVSGRLSSSDENHEGLSVLPGVFVWVPEGLAHRTVAQSAAQTHLALYIDSAFFDRLLKAVDAAPGPALAGVRMTSQPMRHLAALLNHALLAGASRETTAACAGALLHESARLIARQGRLEDTGRLDRMAVAAHAQDILQSQLAEPLGVERLAQTLKLSVRQLQRIFKAETGQTLDGYLASERISQAKRLLAGTTLSVIEIGNAVGWSNPSHFSMQFRRHAGCTPSGFRTMATGTGKH